MPQVFTAVATIASSVFGGAAAGGFMATIGGRLLASVAIGAIQAIIGKALAKSSESSGGIALDQTAVGGTNPMSFQLGTYATAGSAICPELVHGDDDYLNYVIAISDVPGVQLQKLFIDGAEAVIATTTPHADYGQRIEGVFRRERENQLAIDANGNPTITSGFDDHAWIKWYDGSQTVADPMLLDRYSGTADFPWSSAMIGRDLCYAIMTFKYNKDIFETGKPACRFEVTGIPLYDPRKDSTVGGSGAHRWSNRATCCSRWSPMVQAYNVLRGIRITSEITWGGNRTAAQLPLGTWFAAMNACDVLVTNANSTTERKYRSGLEVFLSDEPAQVLTELAKACSAEFANVGGTWFVNVGTPPLPTFFFTDDNILDSEDCTTELMNGDLSDVYNAAIVTYPSPTAAWEKKSTAPMLFPALQAEDQDQRLLANIELPAVPYPRQAQRVGREYVRDSRRRRRSVMAFGPEGVSIDLTGSVSWTSEENGYTAKVFQVEAITEDILSMKRVVNLREKNPSDYDWNPADELPDDPSVGKPLQRKQLPLQGFFVEPWIVRDSSNGSRRCTVRLRWDIDDVPDRVTGVEWRGRLAGETSFRVMGSTGAARVGMALESNVIPNENYEFQARFLTNGRPGVWSTWYAVTAPNVWLGVKDISTADWQSLLTDSAMASGAPGSQGSVWGKLGGYDTYCTYGTQGVFYPVLAGSENARYCVRVDPIPASGAFSGFNTQGEDNRFEAEPGETYRVSMRVRLISGRALVRTSISWLNVAGAEIAISSGTTFDLTTSGQWIPVYADLVAPAGAVYGVPRFIRMNSDLNAGGCFLSRPRVMRRNFNDVTNDGDVSLEWNTYTAGWVTFSGNSGGSIIDSIVINDTDAAKVIGKQAFITFSAQVGLERTGSAGRARGIISFTDQGGTVLSTFAVQHRVAVGEEIQFPITITRKVTVPFALPLEFQVRAESENDAAGAGNVFRMRYRRFEVTAVRK